MGVTRCSSSTRDSSPRRSMLSSPRRDDPRVRGHEAEAPASTREQGPDREQPAMNDPAQPTAPAAAPASQGGGPPGGAAMVGDDYYNAHSAQQHVANAVALPVLARAVAAVPLPAADQVFVIADYGSSQGGNSLLPLATAIRALRARLPAPAPVVVAHQYLPATDFNALFALLHEAPESYLRGTDEVYAFATGQSFYAPVFPAGQVWLGYTSIAVHWLSAAPCLIPGHIWPPRARGAARAALAAQA